MLPYTLAMRSRYRITEENRVYFLTSTVVEWIPAFLLPETRRVVVDALVYCRKEKGLHLYAYVIMENHLHLLAEAPDLSRVMQSFKRHTAVRVMEVINNARQTWMLNQFAYYRKKYKEESRRQFWQEGSHPQLVTGMDMLRQKADYIHANPVRRGWVESPEHWRYSSARNYLLENDSVLEIDPVEW